MKKEKKEILRKKEQVKYRRRWEKSLETKIESERSDRDVYLQRVTLEQIDK